VEKPAWSGELGSDSQFDFSREVIDTTAVDIELDSKLEDSMNTESTTDLETQKYEGMESIQEPEDSAETLESSETVGILEAEPTLNSIPSVFFEDSANGFEALYSEADFTFNTEISAEIVDLDDSEVSSHEPGFEGFSDAGLTENISFAEDLSSSVSTENDVDESESREGSQAQAYVVEIGEIVEFEEPTIIDDPTIGFSQTDLSVDIGSVDIESSITLETDSTEIDSVLDQNSVLVREYADDIEPVDSVSSPAAVKPKGVFKRLIGRAVSWIKRFVGF
jgi:hypothetical protein